MLNKTARFDEGFWSYHTRLFNTLDEARHRYPQDPEVLLARAEAGWQWGGMDGRPFEETLGFYDRAIALDSAFTPCYPHAAFIALAIGDPGRALRYIQAHRRWGPSASVRGVLQLMETLLLPGPSARQRADRLLDSLPVYALKKAMGLLLMSADSGEAVLRVIRTLAARDPEQSDWSYLLGVALGTRGHLRAMMEMSRRNPDVLYWVNPLVAEAIPVDVLHHYRSQWLRTTEPYAVPPPPYFQWLASEGDTAVLAHLARVGGRGSDNEAIANAFRALARRDTADAVARFRAFPDSAILPWRETRLAKAQLMRATGHLDEAARTLRPTLSPWGSDYYPADGLWHLERGRTYERLGDTARARRAYQTVLDLWRHADPELQPRVTEAREALARLQRAR